MMKLYLLLLTLFVAFVKADPTLRGGSVRKPLRELKGGEPSYDRYV
jgi:hypothetical protein